MNQRNRGEHRNVDHRSNVFLGSHPAVDVFEQAGKREAERDAAEKPHRVEPRSIRRKRPRRQPCRIENPELLADLPPLEVRRNL